VVRVLVLALEEELDPVLLHQQAWDEQQLVHEHLQVSEVEEVHVAVKALVSEESLEPQPLLVLEVEQELLQLLALVEALGEELRLQLLALAEEPGERLLAVLLQLLVLVEASDERLLQASLKQEEV